MSAPSTSDRVTVVLTTSPCRIHPNTALVEEVVGSIRACGGDALRQCRLILVCDGYKVRARDKFRSGAVSIESARAYSEYLDRLCFLCARSEASALYGGEMVILEERHGFAHALKRGVFRVTTPYVLVAQHDRSFTRSGIPVKEVLDIMDGHPEVSYCGFPTSTTISHDAKIVGKVFQEGGKKLQLSRRTYPGHHGIELVPLVQFYDSMHVARTSWYLSKIYGKDRFVNLPLGGFIEDTVGQHMVAEIRAHGASAHAQFATFIVEDGTGETMCGHIDGHDPMNDAHSRGSDVVGRAKFRFVADEASWPDAVRGLADAVVRLQGTGHYSERRDYLSSLSA
ncbi:hypothetical protein OT_ostta12g01480 [Ostreococcus tauri]|uniref:Uncharacterized protein n=1 Tax=Ostreococcus tauri TaxID=70448 RepID=Q00Y07_OSTTA|nr:hypothetical protein OT_ostta12g01480 [Ostreococcus tauri]OUS43020.1 hypothetical protein BE221DRAFT_195017 [Ostreococcus tauri]CAL57244.1 hypothetical protein OT_ostta12g01480 [Ostreococcus tauri]|eukprot:XP_003082298.1 hypothetical protein OT_ostta12g01480 [Ostreococcus tauri]